MFLRTRGAPVTTGPQESNNKSGVNAQRVVLRRPELWAAGVVAVDHDVCALTDLEAADVGGGGDAPIVVRRVVFLDLGINDESGFALVLGGTVLRAVVVRQELSVGSALAYSDGHV